DRLRPPRVGICPHTRTLAVRRVVLQVSTKRRKRSARLRLEEALESQQKLAVPPSGLGLIGSAAGDYDDRLSAHEHVSDRRCITGIRDQDELYTGDECRQRTCKLRDRESAIEQTPACALDRPITSFGMAGERQDKRIPITKSSAGFAQRLEQH